MIVRESYISNLVIYLQYFYIFVFANDRKCKQMNMYIYILKKKCSDSFFSFLCAEVIFPEKKKPWIYANRDKSKDVQNITLNVYCTVYSICLTRRVNVSILQVWSRIQEVNVYSGFVLEKMADYSLWAPGQSDIDSMSKPKISPYLKFIFIIITAPVYPPPQTLRFISSSFH